MKRSFLFAACMLLATSTLLAQAKFDVIHYGLAMSFDFKKGKLYLEELITLERLDNGKQIALDLITKDNDGYGMEVISVKYMKDPIPWHQDSSHLYIDISTITEYKENNLTENGISINYLMSREIKVSLKDSIGFFIKMKVKKCPEIEGEDCETIFEDTSLEYYTY